MSELSINTTQNVKINFIAASVGERLGSYIIDLIIKGSYLLVVGLVLFYFFHFERVLDSLDT